MIARSAGIGLWRPSGLLDLTVQVMQGTAKCRVSSLAPRAACVAASRLHQLRHILKPCSAHTQPCHVLSTALPEVIQITPTVSLFDEKVHIKVHGLSSNAKVTLHLETEQEWRREPVLFVSCSHHVASQLGDVDLNTNPSQGGTYTGLDPMGLFWSMQASPDGPQNARMVMKNVEEPCVYTLSIFPGHITLNDLHASGAEYQPLSVTTISRLKKAADVKRLVIREGGVRGVLFLPPGKGPHPGVIDMFGSAGGIMELRAALLASHGFAALALPFFRYEDLPPTLEEVQFQYFQEAAEWLNSHSAVKDSGISVVGASKGAELGLLMAWQCPQVVAAVQINGPPFYSIYDIKKDDQPFVKGVPLDMGFIEITDEGVNIMDALPHTPEHIIPVWESSAHILTLISDDDRQLRPDLGEELYNMYPEDKRHLIEVVHYPGAGHLLEPPYTPNCHACINPSFNTNMLWGGHPAEHAAAQADSWQRILQFLNKHLR